MGHRCQGDLAALRVSSANPPLSGPHIRSASPAPPPYSPIPPPLPGCARGRPAGEAPRLHGLPGLDLRMGNEPAGMAEKRRSVAGRPGGNCIAPGDDLYFIRCC